MAFSSTVIVNQRYQHRQRGVTSIQSRASSSHSSSTSSCVRTDAPSDAEELASIVNSEREKKGRRSAISKMTLLTSLFFSTASHYSSSYAEQTEEEEEEEGDLNQEELDAYVKSVISKNSGEVNFIDVDSEIEDEMLKATYAMSSFWRSGRKLSNTSVEDSSLGFDGLTDPVNGKVASKLLFKKIDNVSLDSIEELAGKPEDIEVARQLYLNDSFQRSDMLGAAKRTGENGVIYYDFEFVVSPPAKSCPSALGCLYPEHIYLVSVCVANKSMFEMVIDANPELWRVAGSSLKNVRSSFRVAEKTTSSEQSEEEEM